MFDLKEIIKWIKKEFKWHYFILLTVGGIVNAIGVTIFLSPVGLIDGGISGASMLLSGFLPKIFGIPTFSVFLIILNFPFFTFGMRKQGIAFSVYSRYAITIYSIAAWIITHWMPLDLIGESPLAGTDKILCAAFGGMIVGAGRGLTIRFNGALDGIEVMAVIFAKRLGITVGTFVMMYNVVLYIACGLVAGSWILPLYSIVAYTVSLKTIDYIVEGVDRAKSIMIVTENPDEVISALSREFGFGCTRIAAKGGYSNNDKTIIYFVVNRFQLPKFRKIMQAVDGKAYMTVSDVADVIKTSSK